MKKLGIMRMGLGLIVFVCFISLWKRGLVVMVYMSRVEVVIIRLRVNFEWIFL